MSRKIRFPVDESLQVFVNRNHTPDETLGAAYNQLRDLAEMIDADPRQSEGDFRKRVGHALNQVAASIDMIRPGFIAHLEREQERNDQQAIDRCMAL